LFYFKEVEKELVGDMGEISNFRVGFYLKLKIILCSPVY